MNRLARVVLVGLAVSCSGQSGTSTLTLDWQPVDSLNAMLPDGIRVFAGRREAMPLRAWYVRIDDEDPGIRTFVLQSDDTTDNRETVANFATGTGACVAVNGGYFSMGVTPARHAGLLMTGGSVRAPATRRVVRDAVAYEVARAALGITDQGDIQITWATTRNDSVFSWNRPPRNRQGVPAPALDYDEAVPWPVVDAVGAGPMLVADGRIRITTDEEVFFGSSIPQTHPRTAAGQTRDGALIVLVVDGRQPESRGVNLEELAQIMLDLGAIDALNLDGGGSATLVVNGVLLNRPTGGTTQREVMSALVTTCR
ncbi:MAG: phosphodiester glycosidase family protein [Gemmatimonadales bacterium]